LRCEAEGRAGALKQAAEQLPGGRIGTASEVGKAMVFLLTNGYVNAEVMHIDGGHRYV